MKIPDREGWNTNTGDRPSVKHIDIILINEDGKEWTYENQHSSYWDFFLPQPVYVGYWRPAK